MCNYCSINAGSTALPALLNIKQVMQQRQVTGIWSGKDELPVRYTICDILYPSIYTIIILMTISLINLKFILLYSDNGL